MEPGIKRKIQSNLINRLLCKGDDELEGIIDAAKSVLSFLDSQHVTVLKHRDMDGGLRWFITKTVKLELRNGADDAVVLGRR